MSRICRVLRLQGSGQDLAPFEPLKTRFPDARFTPVGIEIPLDSQEPEEVLAICCAEKLPVRGSLVMRRKY